MKTGGPREPRRARSVCNEPNDRYCFHGRARAHHPRGRRPGGHRARLHRRGDARGRPAAARPRRAGDDGGHRRPRAGQLCQRGGHRRRCARQARRRNHRRDLPDSEPQPLCHLPARHRQGRQEGCADAQLSVRRGGQPPARPRSARREGREPLQRRADARALPRAVRQQRPPVHRRGLHRLLHAAHPRERRRGRGDLRQ